jgi:phosphate transport system permease protein
MTTAILAALLLLTVLGFTLGKNRSIALAGGNWKKLHSLPSYYGAYVALWCGLPALALFGLWIALEPRILETIIVRDLPVAMIERGQAQLGLIFNDIRNIAVYGVGDRTVDPAVIAAVDHYKSLKSISFAALAVAVLALAILGLGWSQRRVVPAMRARNRVERIVMVLLIACSTLSVLTTVGIVLSLFFESLRFFHAVPFWDFLFGLQWSPQTAMRADQVGSSGAFGAVPLFAGTILITVIAMAVAVPIGLLVAVYMSDYASRRGRAVIKPMLEILAGIPTVVYGFFAALTMAPFIRGMGEAVGLSVASESALAAGLVMGIMIVPFVSSLSDDAMNAVPQSLRDGSAALGATKSETIRQVVIPAALPGIVGGVLLAVSRAIGETMIVVMAAGLSANLTANPLQAVTTVTVQIATLLVGDQEFDSPKTLAAFALGLLLFFVTLALNLVALHVVRRYRERYD